jgi:hypothetical protein
VLKDDVPLQLYALPYVVAHALQAPGDVLPDLIVREIDVVLRAAGAGSSDTGARHLQTIFTLLDTLGRWCDANEESSAFSSARVRTVLARIPARPLADAAFRAAAYARALMYMELHIADRRKTLQAAACRAAQAGQVPDVPVAGIRVALDSDDIAFMQRVYQQLNEGDGVEGTTHTEVRRWLMRVADRGGEAARTDQHGRRAARPRDARALGRCPCGLRDGARAWSVVPERVCPCC